VRYLRTKKPPKTISFFKSPIFWVVIPLCVVSVCLAVFK
jgi:hypothetical protein